jgi:hypothetical protein
MVEEEQRNQVDIEQERKRALYQEQRKNAGKKEAKTKKGPKKQSSLNQESLINRPEKKNSKTAPNDEENEEEQARELKKKQATERLEKSQALLNKDKSEGGGKRKAIKDAMSAIKEQGSEEVFKQASGFIHNILWGSLFTPSFLFSLAGLNIYFLASAGLFDSFIPELSKKISPFGLLIKLLGRFGGMILGTLVLGLLDLILLALLLFIFLIIYWFIHPGELIKFLPAWEKFENLFNL